jgi:hypothetical protein
LNTVPIATAVENVRSRKSSVRAKIAE